MSDAQHIELMLDHLSKFWTEVEQIIISRGCFVPIEIYYDTGKCLSINKIHGKWRIIHTYSNYLPTPITDCSSQIRIACIPYAITLAESVQLRNKEFAKSLSESIIDCSNILVRLKS